MTRIALLRHGHTEWNREGRLQGRSDIPLDDDARHSLLQLRLPPPWDEAKVVASPLKRAMETAKIVSGRNVRPVPALIEMNWGDWEGRISQELRDEPQSGFRDIESWGWEYRPPGGESVGELRDRLTPWLAGIDTPTLAVCHIGVMRVLLSLATGWNFNGPAPFKVKRNRIYVLDLSANWPVWDDAPIRLIERGP